jgi:hypothetical protein
MEQRLKTRDILRMMKLRPRFRAWRSSASCDGPAQQQTAKRLSLKTSASLGGNCRTAFPLYKRVTAYPEAFPAPLRDWPRPSALPNSDRALE